MVKVHDRPTPEATYTSAQHHPPLAANAKDSAAICGVSRAQWFKLHSTGRIPAPVRLGAKAPRWIIDELKAWMAEGCPNRADWEKAKAAARKGARLG